MADRSTGHLHPTSSPLGPDDERVDERSRPAPRLGAFATPGPIPVVWTVLILAVVAWSAWRLGATDLAATVTASDGSRPEVPNTFATVDHPWHVARAQTLLESLRDGELLRWVGKHQGGYPAEFYPLGVPWLTVGVWGLSIGSLSIASAFKLVVIGVFLAPVLAFLLLGRRDGAALPIAGLGLVAHVAVPGEWWSGGYTETVQWGLITNVAAYTAALGFLGALLAYARRPGPGALVLAVGLSVFAVGTNTRSVIALGCAVAGVVVSVLIERGITVGEIRSLLVRLAVVGVPAVLLATPLWLNAVRFGDLYVFIRYEFYADLGAWWTSSVIAVSWPVMILGLIGFGIGLVGPAGPATRAVAWTLLCFAAATLVLGGLGENGGLVPQLEATRLMPFQRLLLIYLAARTVVAGAQLAQRRIRSAGPVHVGLTVATAVIALIFIGRPPGFVAEDQRSMFPVETTANAEYADLQIAVEAADDLAAPGTALLVAGSELGWHQPMWAPVATDRPLRYNDWLWLWQTWHRSPDLRYDGQAIDPDTVGRALEREYLTQQAVGAVITLTPQMEAIADRSPSLRRVDNPGYALYLVDDAVPMVSVEAGTASDISISNHRISAVVTGDGGVVTIRETWFPRWEARVNGQRVAVERDEFGRMRVPVPAGEVALDLVYGVGRVDLAARVASVIGAVLALVVVIRPSIERRLSRQSDPASPPRGTPAPGGLRQAHPRTRVGA